MVAGCTSSSNSTSRADASRAVAPAAQATSVAALLSSGAPAAKPRDAYVLLSGGGTPLSNNYSQYLQAKGIAAYLGRECPPDATWVFFGVGNRDGTAPVLADARRELKQDGLVVQSWLPGSLARNRPDVCGIRLYVHGDNARAIETYRRLGMTMTEYRLCEEVWSGRA